MNITLNSEQRAALDSLKQAHKKQTNLDLTDDDYIATVMTGLIESEAKRLFDLAVQRLAEGAKAMPFADRVALIQRVESQIPS